MEWSEKWNYVRPFLLLLLLHALAIFLFTRGFLLTRTELSAYSQCSDPRHHTASGPPPPSCLHTNSSARCWTKPAVDRVVIIVVDALRFDFVAPSAFFDEKKPWMDKLTVLQRLAAKHSTSARIFKAFADPPTTSLQRLKGLTTGGLPTFIDVGNSFGALAIIEDNLMYQLSKNGKRVLMMGDDTWLQLFPDQFVKSFPYPSFNVKDLDTVDDGCIEHLFPSLYKDDWDVLIAHFLGVDHAGHIFGVDSSPMIQKLEQYNSVLEKVVEILKQHSGPGGLHENTYLIVMGDHGQTINGDHGGGTPEEVETSLFAMSLRSGPLSVLSILSSDSCRHNLDGEKICVGSIQQIDFSATMAALLGIPFPFGSIGRVSPELYALSAGTWCTTAVKKGEHGSDLKEWMQNYVNALCINCWQVKRYIDLYSASSVIGFPPEDLQLVAELYTRTQTNWSSRIRTKSVSDHGNIIPVLERQIGAYSEFLQHVAHLARSKWTEFDLNMMAVGIMVLFISLLFHCYFIMRFYKLLKSAYLIANKLCAPFRVTIPFFIVAIRANSFLSDSYILAEGKVANFLLATTTVANVRNAIVYENFVVKDAFSLALTILLRFSFEAILSKQTVDSATVNISSEDQLVSGRVGISILMAAIYEILPIILVLLLAFMLYTITYSSPCWKTLKVFIIGTIFSYLLIGLHWASEINLVEIPIMLRIIGKTFVPWAVYSIGLGLILLAIIQTSQKTQSGFEYRRILDSTVAMMCAWSSTIIMLLGRQGPIVAFLSIFGGWCIIRLQKVSQLHMDGTPGSSFMDALSTTQWNLLAVCLFFYTGHWCTFDGLRYGAAFIGFDEFNLVRQGALLAIDTFGVSHISAILGLPFLVVFSYKNFGGKHASPAFFCSLALVFLIYGLEIAITTTFTIICVTIQRRHLMVWGLFAPKYVFDVVGLILTDVLIFLASLYYF